jgi:phage shock protein PspC (stress-responsive transcriptional regulator)
VKKADGMPKLTTLFIVMVILNLIGLTIAAYFIMRRK